jgi:hypothetical protein
MPPFQGATPRQDADDPRRLASRNRRPFLRRAELIHLLAPAVMDSDNNGDPKFIPRFALASKWQFVNGLQSAGGPGRVVAISSQQFTLIAKERAQHAPGCDVCPHSWHFRSR